jgi:adenylate cyclase
MPNVRKAEVTVFFSDIAGFSTMAEQLPQDPFMALLAEYLDAMSEIIMEHRGIVGEFIGDAIMAWWNAPLHLGEKHTQLAVAAALRQQERLAELREAWKESGFPQVKARMGLVRGQVMAGNIGSTKRMKYGLVGDCVNLASRLECLCKHYGVSILVDDEASRAPGVRERFLLRHLDTVTVLGRKTRTELYEVVGRRRPSSWDTSEGASTPGVPELIAFCDEFDDIQTLYRSHDFDGALRALDDYQARWPQDTPAALLRDRCQREQRQGVQADWSPTVNFDHK